MFIDYKFGIYRKEIRALLRKRLQLKDSLNYHKKKISHHNEKINILKTETLPQTEKELNLYLKKAGN